jgi:hypothetical protein
MEGGVMRWEGEVSYQDEKGREYTGSFRVDNKGILTVHYGADRKRTQLGGHVRTPNLLARILLSELVGAAHKDGFA